jgi:hypothetical protein
VIEGASEILAMLLAIQPLGHTAGLKVNRGSPSVQTAGWQAVNAGLLTSETAATVVAVEVMYVFVERYVVVVKTSLQFGGCVKGMVSGGKVADAMVVDARYGLVGQLIRCVPWTCAHCLDAGGIPCASRISLA